MRNLHLVSPHMHGQDVRDLQSRLAKQEYYKGAIEGEYGPLTAQAVHRAKYRLGYPSPDQVAGDRLFNILGGSVKPGLLMRTLAKKRALKDQKKVKKVNKLGALTHGQLIVQKALSQLGETEHPPDSNRSKYSLWYGIIGAWCAMFVTWVHCSLNFSARTFKRGIRYAYVPYIYHDAVAGINGLMLAHGPGDGIVLCYDWQHDHTADHTGIAAEEETLRRLAPLSLKAAIAQFGPLGAMDFWAIEGNTAVGNDSNGGTVELRKRDRTLVQGFVKVAA